MSTEVVKVALNQQQLELLDATIKRGVAADRESLVRLALREFADRHRPTDRKGASGHDNAGS
jgi:DNA phosphorothioation-dependent restriction protein DptG